MNDALLVRGRESVRDLRGDLDRFARRDGAPSETVAQRLAFQQLRDEVGRPVVIADVIDGEEVGMVEHPGRARLLFEALQLLLIAQRDRGEDFDGDIAPEPRVLRAVNRTHSPFAENPCDPGGAKLFGESHSKRL